MEFVSAQREEIKRRTSDAFSSSLIVCVRRWSKWLIRHRRRPWYPSCILTLKIGFISEHVQSLARLYVRAVWMNAIGVSICITLGSDIGHGISVSLEGLVLWQRCLGGFLKTGSELSTSFGINWEGGASSRGSTWEIQSNIFSV